MRRGVLRRQYGWNRKDLLCERMFQCVSSLRERRIRMYDQELGGFGLSLRNNVELSYRCLCQRWHLPAGIRRCELWNGFLFKWRIHCRGNLQQFRDVLAWFDRELWCLRLRECHEFELQELLYHEERLCLRLYLFWSNLRAAGHDATHHHTR